MQERQNKMFLNYKAQKFEHVSNCSGWAKNNQTFCEPLRFYWTILSVINSVCFQMQKREPIGYVLNCK